MKRGQWLFVALILASASGAAIANMPDGLTPAEEGVCDILKEPGVTPGLYGLCVAYCEAHDADLYDPEARCKKSDAKLLAKYNERKSETDPDMPCLKSPCPCWSDSLLAEVLDIRSCTLGTSDWPDECFSISLDVETSDPNNERLYLRVIDTHISGLGECQFDDNPSVGFEDADQRDACRAGLQDLIDSLGKKCKVYKLKCKK